MADELLNGSRWFQAGIVLGGLLLAASRIGWSRGLSARARLLRELHLFHAVVIAMQAIGHMVAVTIGCFCAATSAETIPWAGGV